MKFSISRESLLKPLQQLTSVVEKRQTLPVLFNVLIIAENNELTLISTDMEIEMVARISSNEIAEEGRTTVSAHKLLDICKTLPADASIGLSLSEGKMKVSSGRGRYSLVTLPAEDFPALDEETREGGLNLALAPNQLLSLFRNTSFSMAQQDVRYYLNGMLIEITDSQLRAVATDGHRLALTDVALAQPQSGVDAQIILPRKGVAELSRLLSVAVDDDEETVNLTIGKNSLRLEFAGYAFTSKLIDGKFPDYNRVIPKNNNTQCKFDKEVFRQALSRVLVLSNEKYRGARLGFSNNLVTLRTNNPEQEEAEEEVIVDYQGEGLEIGFNITYLMDILSNTANDSIVMELGDSNSSALLFDEKQPASIYVVMPMRL